MQAKKSPQQMVYEKMLRIHAFIERNENCDVRTMCLAFGVAESTIRHSLALLYDSGHIDKREGKRRHQGQEPGVYFVTGIDKPIVAPTRKNNKVYKRRADSPPDATIKRKFTEAKQIGMVRDELVAFLFGQAVPA